MHIQMRGQGVDISAALCELTGKKLHCIQPCRDEISNIRIIFHINKLKKSSMRMLNYREASSIRRQNRMTYIKQSIC